MPCLRLRFLPAFIIIFSVVLSISEASPRLTANKVEISATSIDHGSSSDQLLKPNYDAKRDILNPSNDISRNPRISRISLDPPLRLEPSLTSRSPFALSLSEHSSSAHTPNSLSPRSNFDLHSNSTIRMIVNTFIAIIDPPLNAISHFIDFWLKLIYLVDHNFASRDFGQTIKFVYGHFTLIFMTTNQDTISSEIIKLIGTFFLNYTFTFILGAYYLTLYLGPIVIFVRLLVEPLGREVVHNLIT